MLVRDAFSFVLIAMPLFVASEVRDNQVRSPANESNKSAASLKQPTQTLSKLEGAPALTDEAVRAFQQQFSTELPNDYRTFMLESNGGFPAPYCVVFEEDGLKTVSDVFCFLAIGDQRGWASIQWNLEAYSGRLPSNTIPIARDSCGNLWLMSLEGEQAGAIFFWDHGTFNTFDETDLTRWPRVAGSFTEFRENLRDYDQALENDTVLSRYALVRQAEEGMARNHPGFTTRANPSFVWHCHSDEQGTVRMEFVRYEIHAQTTHTDGYSRLRAIKGVIEEGPTRLPE